MTFDENVEILKGALEESLTNAILVKLISIFPFIPVSITEKLVRPLVRWLVNETDILTFIKFTDFRTSAQGRNFYEAALGNYEAQRDGDEKKKAVAKKHLINSFRALAKFTN